MNTEVERWLRRVREVCDPAYRDAPTEEDWWEWDARAGASQDALIGALESTERLITLTYDAAERVKRATVDG